MSSAWSRAKAVLQWLSGMSMFYRFVLGATVGALGGSGFIAFVNKYAMYRYAYSYGCRIPVEGVPYLALAVSAVSFAFLATALLCSTLMYGFLLLFRFILWHTFPDSVEREHGWSAFRKWLREYGPPAVSFLAVVMIAAQTKELSFGVRSSQIGNGVIIYLATIPVLFWPNLAKWYSFAMAIAMSLLITVTLFIPSFYAAMLRLGRFGGGVEVTITRQDEGQEPKQEETYLFLATSDQYITFDKKSNKFVEIPRHDVKLVMYSPEPQYALPQFSSPADRTETDPPRSAPR